MVEMLGRLPTPKLSGKGRLHMRLTSVDAISTRQALN